VVEPIRSHSKAIADGIGGGKNMPMVKPVCGIVKGQILGHLDYPINYEFVRKVNSFCVIYRQYKGVSVGHGKIIFGHANFGIHLSLY